jgi:hypothetical protein
MSKVLETVAKEELEAFIKDNNILPSLQHGFRKGRSWRRSGWLSV